MTLATIRVTRYFVSSEGHEMAIEPSYSVKSIELVEGDENARKVVHYALRPGEEIIKTLGLPEDFGTWREMTEEEALDYIKRKEEEERNSVIVSLGDDDEDEADV